MKTRQVIPLLMMVVVVALIVANPVRGQGGISVTGADSMLQYAVNRPISLEATTNNISDRYVLYYADKLRFIDPLNALPTDWNIILEQTPVHVTMFYADKIRYVNLNAVSASLLTLFSSVPKHIVLYYADKMRNVDMQSNYPALVINDTTPPQISAVKDNAINNDTVVITWVTDDFADSTIVYGMQSGVYTQSTNSPLFVKQHTITLTQIIADIDYYYKVRSTNQSGNMSESPEYLFVVQSQKYIYLPIVLK